MFQESGFAVVAFPGALAVNGELSGVPERLPSAEEIQRCRRRCLHLQAKSQKELRHHHAS
jgi:hypothetical protein